MLKQRVTSVDAYYEKCRKIANGYIEKGEYLRALSFLHSFTDKKSQLERLMDLADVYAEMGLYELSNRCWFKYIDKAPKDKISIAYEELAINFFYLDNLLTSSYYFHKKVATDGFISREGIDKEILDYFEQSTNGKHNYHLAYPFEMADYSYTLKEAKRALVVGDVKSALNKYNQIPKGCKQYKDAQTELSVAQFLSGEVEQGIETCRAVIKEEGGDLITYCHLSSMYKYNDDLEKSKIYFERALEFLPKNIDEHFKLATCALEQGKTSLAIEHLEIVLKERPYEVSLKYFYGLALINVKRYEDAKIQFSQLSIISPNDVAVKYYYDFVSNLSLENEKSQKLEGFLPLSYIEGLPEKEAKLRAKKISELTDVIDKKRVVSLKNPTMKEYLKWGLQYGNDGIARKSIFLISCGDDSLETMLLDYLLNNEADSELKRIISYMLILKGRKKKFGVVSHNFYVSIKPRKFAFENTAQGEVFFNAYALCLSKMAFTGLDVADKVAFSVDKLYKKHSENTGVLALNGDELGALIALNANVKNIGEREILKIFDLKKNRFTQIKKLLQGEIQK